MPIVAETQKSARAAPAPTVSPPQAQKYQFFTLTTVIAIFAALGIAAYLVTRYLLHLPFQQCRWILIAVLIAGGAPLVIDLARKAFAGNFGSDLLAGISIVTSVVLGEYLAGSIVVLMLVRRHGAGRICHAAGLVCVERAGQKNAAHRPPQTR